MERTYTIPLRKEFSKTKPYKRAKKSVSAVRQFLERHMKSTDVRIGKHLNLKLWEHGIKNPPPRVSVVATKDEKGVVRAELVGAPVEAVKEVKTDKKPQAPIVAAEKKETVAKKDVASAPAAKEEKAAEVKETPKKETADVKEKKEEEKKAPADEKKAE